MSARAPLTLAIVGRPNVGKSTLFNRLAGRRLAIVHDRPGVTRDRREAKARLGDLDLVLIDTAGFEDVAGDSLEARMRAQTEAAVAAAEIVLFVIDARAGVTALDRSFGELLRRSGRPVIVLANKCEGKAGEPGLIEAFSLGLGEPIPISAEHGEGMSDLYAVLVSARPQHEAAAEDAKGETDAPAQDEEPDDKAPLRIAVVGRPNAGKSTLINTLLGEERLLTGPEPGVTRDAIAVRWIWDGREVRLTDTAGMRKRARIEDEVERLSVSDTIRAIRFAEVVIVVLDAQNAFERQDLQIADLAIREGRAVLFAATKWDLVEEPQKALAELRERAERLLPQIRGAPLIPVSGLTGRGLDKLMPAILKLRSDWSVKVKTRDLNDWLGEAVARHPPPAVGGRRIKPRYIAQTKARPPTFVLICSRAADLPEAYVRYLVNGIRDAFDLPAVPIRLTVKAGENPYAPDDAGRRSRK